MKSLGTNHQIVFFFLVSLAVDVAKPVSYVRCISLFPKPVLPYPETFGNNSSLDLTSVASHWPLMMSPLPHWLRGQSIVLGNITTKAQNTPLLISQETLVFSPYFE